MRQLGRQPRCSLCTPNCDETMMTGNNITGKDAALVCSLSSETSSLLRFPLLVMFFFFFFKRKISYWDKIGEKLEKFAVHRAILYRSDWK
jgi:hypothetical protein